MGAGRETGQSVGDGSLTFGHTCPWQLSSNGSSRLGHFGECDLSQGEAIVHFAVLIDVLIELKTTVTT